MKENLKNVLNALQVYFSNDNPHAKFVFRNIEFVELEKMAKKLGMDLHIESTVIFDPETKEMENALWVMDKAGIEKTNH